MRSQGRSFMQFASTDERARFITWNQERLDQWIYANPDGTLRTWKQLAELIGVSTDQVSRWVKGEAVPGKAAGEKMFGVGVYPEPRGVLIISKPWMSSEPDAATLAAKSKPKKAAKPKKTPATQPAAQPAPDVAAPEFEVVSDVFDVIAADSDISVRITTVLSALVALARAGVTLDIDVKVRAR